MRWGEESVFCRCSIDFPRFLAYYEVFDMNTENKGWRKIYEFFSILLGGVLIPPLGIILLFSGLNKDNKNMRRNGIILLLCGAGLLLLFIPMFSRVYPASYDGRTALFKSLFSAALPLLGGLFLVITGIFYTTRAYRDKRLIHLVCSDQILDLSDLCVLMSCSVSTLRVRIDRLLKEKRLPGICAVRKEAEAVSGCFLLKRFSKSSAAPGKNVLSKIFSGTVLRNILWIAASLFAFEGDIHFQPIALFLIFIAYLLEKRNALRRYSIIYISAYISMTFSLYLLFLDTQSALSGASSSAYPMFRALLSGLPTSALQLAAYVRLSVRESQSICGLIHDPSAVS